METHGLDTETQVFFYEQDYYVLSNFSAFRLRWKGHDFDTSEAAYHWEKFSHGADTPEEAEALSDICGQIKRARSAHEAFKIAEANKHLVHPEWKARRIPVMLDILRAKADQHEYVSRKLDATDNRELVENSWRDDFWGWGPNRDGKNMLGKLWVKVRDERRAKQAKAA